MKSSQPSAVSSQRRGTPITKAQIQKIKVMQRRLGLDDGDYRLMLWNVAGVKSCTELRGGKVTAVMEHLGRCLGEAPPSPQPSPARGEGVKRAAGGDARPTGAVLRATERQLELLFELWGQVTRVPFTQPRERRQALRAWLQRTVKVSHENFLTRDQARAAIEGLKSMAAREGSKPKSKGKTEHGGCSRN